MISDPKDIKIDIYKLTKEYQNTYNNKRYMDIILNVDLSKLTKEYQNTHSNKHVELSKLLI